MRSLPLMWNMRSICRAMLKVPGIRKGRMPFISPVVDPIVLGMDSSARWPMSLIPVMRIRLRPTSTDIRHRPAYRASEHQADAHHQQAREPIVRRPPKKAEPGAYEKKAEEDQLTHRTPPINRLQMPAGRPQEVGEKHICHRYFYTTVTTVVPAFEYSVTEIGRALQIQRGAAIFSIVSP